MFMYGYSEFITCDFYFRYFEWACVESVCWLSHKGRPRLLNVKWRVNCHQSVVKAVTEDSQDSFIFLFHFTGNVQRRQFHILVKCCKNVHENTLLCQILIVVTFYNSLRKEN